MTRSEFAILCMALLVTACDNTEDRYIPLGAELRHEYRIELTINGESRQQKQIIASLGPRKIGGREVYPRRSAGGLSYYLLENAGGIYTTRDPGVDGSLLLPSPITLNRIWQSPTSVYILDNRHETFAGGESFISVGEPVIFNHTITSMDDEVRVPAGSYQDCLRIESRGSVAVEARTSGIEQILVRQTDWYARGIGLVKRVREETTVPARLHGTLVQELVSAR